MEEILIEAVKKHEVLYKKSSLVYRNKFKRAAAWNSIAEELNVPADVCQARWKTLRDRFVKKHAENYRASGSGAELEENQWQYYQQMEFLTEHIKPRKTVTSLTSPQSLYEKNADESSADASSFALLEDHSQSIESLADSPFLDVELTTFSADIPPASVRTLSTEPSSSTSEERCSSRKRPRRDTDSEAFSDFLNKMAKIAETRFAVPSSQKESGTHEGFFSMLRDIFDDLPSDVVKNAKFYFINYLRDQMAATAKK